MWEIYTYGGANTLASLFQAMAAFTATSDWIALFRMLLIVTSLVVAFEMAFTGSFKPVPRVLIFILVFNAAIINKTDIQLVDVVEPVNSTSIDNVPVGVAVPASFLSTVGYYLADAFETIFSLPNDVEYHDNGLVFAARLVQASTEFEVADPTFARNLGEFIRGCVYYGANVGWFSWGEIYTAPDLWAYIRAEGMGNAIFVPYEDSAGNTTLTGCQTVSNNLNAQWASAVDKTVEVFGVRIFKDPNVATAKASLLAALPASYGYMAGISSSAADLVRQTTMINAMRRGFTAMASSADASAAVQDFAMAQAEVQQRTTYNTLGALAGRTLPLIRAVLEFLVYGLFPIFAILVVISLQQGKVALMYIKLIAWLQLWAPLYALLHFAMLSYGAEQTQANAMINSAEALTLATAGGMNAVNADLAAMAGYLAWTVPMMSLALVMGGGMALGMMAGSLGGVAQSAGTSASQSASTGNLSLGNMSMDNSNMWGTNNAPSHKAGVGTYMDATTGATYTHTSGGSSAVGIMQSDLGMKAGLTDAVKSGVSTQASQSMQAAKSEMSDYTRSVGATFSDMQRFASQQSTDKGVNHDWSKSETSGFQQNFGKVMKQAESFGQSRGYTSAQAAQLLAAASVSTPGLNLGIVELRGMVQASHRTDAQLMDDWKAAQQVAKETNFGESWDKAVRAGQSAAASVSQRTGDSFAQSMEGGFNKNIGHKHATTAAMQEAVSWQQAASRVQESGFTLSMDASSAFREFMVGQDKKFGGAMDSQSPTWTQGEVDQLMTAAANGDANALRVLSAHAQDYAQQEGLALAGVQEAPANNVAATHAANESDTWHREFQTVRGRAEGFKDQVAGEASAAGMPSDGAIQENMGKTIHQAGVAKYDMGENTAGGQQKLEQATSAAETGVRQELSDHPMLDIGRDSAISGAENGLGTPNIENADFGNNFHLSGPPGEMSKRSEEPQGGEPAPAAFNWHLQDDDAGGDGEGPGRKPEPSVG